VRTYDLIYLNTVGNARLNQVCVKDDNLANTSADFTKDPQTEFVDCSKVEVGVDYIINKSLYIYQKGNEITFSVSGEYEYSIYDSMGNLILEGTTFQKISANGITSGIYLMKAVSSDGETINEKILVNF
jgi:hypothetical protein